MRVPLPSTALGALPEAVDVDLADAPEVPANRAARRGRAGRKSPSGAVHAGSSGRARAAAQGRRINPVRRNAG
jgi:hypothetical protein